MTQPLAEWSDAEISRVIVESLSPMPIVDWTYGTEVLLRAVRENKYWFPVTGSRKWEPRDIPNDPAMVLMLLEEANLQLTPTWCGFGEYRRTGWQAMPMAEERDYRSVGYAVTIGRAVALAYILAYGLEGK